MRRVKVIALAMAAVLAGAINMVGTGSEGAAGKGWISHHGAQPVSSVRHTSEATSRYSMIGSRPLADATAGAASARAKAAARAKAKAAAAARARAAAAARAKAAAAAAFARLAAAERARAAAAATAAAEQARSDAAAQAQVRAPATVASGAFVCPVQGGGLHFVDTWGVARAGGRTHKGTDMIAAYGTPTVAPVSGRVEHSFNSLGGYSWHLYGDNGNMYYGAHLSSYAGGDGHVSAGTVIGYVGMSGDAQGTVAHLHFEYHPGGGAAIDSYPLVSRYCPGG
jgi:murein DD-endopeptidase MepM/ murein hydrolase activator NlpD